MAAAIAATPPRALAIAAGWTLAAYFVLTFYDRLATRYAGHRLSWRRTAFASFCAYVLSHNLGFSAVSGAPPCATGSTPPGGSSPPRSRA